MSDQAMPIQHRMNRAAGRDLHRVRQSSQQALVNLPCTPVGLLALGCDACRFHLRGQLVSISKRPAGPITQTFQAARFIALKDLVTSLSGNTELPAQRSHTLSIFEPNHKPHSFVHNSTFLPWHPSSRPLAGGKV